MNGKQEGGVITGSDAAMAAVMAKALGTSGYHFLKQVTWGSEIGNTGAWTGTVGAVSFL